MLKFVQKLFFGSKTQTVSVPTVNDDENEVSPKRRNGVRSYTDGPDDFKEGEVVTGSFVKFYLTKHPHIWYAFVDIDDGRKTRVALKYFSSVGDAVYHLVKGDRLKLFRQQYSTKHHHSSWQVLEFPIRVLSQLEDAEKSHLLKPKNAYLSSWPEQDEDFDVGKLEDGHITSMIGPKKNPAFAIVELSDLTVTRVSRLAFSHSGLRIKDFKPGDGLLLEKIGYIPEHHITKWNIKAVKQIREQRPKNPVPEAPFSKRF